MLRAFVCTLAVLAFSAGALRAEPIKATVKSTDQEKLTLTVTIDQKEQTYPVAAEHKITIGGVTKKEGAKFSNIKPGLEVKLEIQKVGTREVVVGIDLPGRTKK